MKKVLIPIMALLVLFTVTPVMGKAEPYKIEGSFLYDEYTVEYRGISLFSSHEDGSGGWHVNMKYSLRYKVYVTDTGEIFGTGHDNGQENAVIRDGEVTNAISRANMRIKNLDIQSHVITKWLNGEIQWVKILPKP